MAKIQNTTLNAGEVVGQELSFIAGGNEKWYSLFTGHFGNFS